MFLILFLSYFMLLIFKKDQLAEQINNPEYQEYIKSYRKQVDQEMQEYLDDDQNQQKYDLSVQGSSSGGTTGNFEGPQVHLKAIKFHNEVLTEEDDRLIHMDGVSAHFDPDHPCFGLPDVDIRIQDVRLYRPEKSSIDQFMNLGSETEARPYKIYRKRIVTDSLGAKSKLFIMQLWMTEFQVNINISPDQNCSGNISDEELESIAYPGYWYGSSLPRVKLADLHKESLGLNDNRYGNLSFILEIIPDNSPIYIKTNNATTSKADFAIAAVYCSEAMIGNEPKVQRISTNVHAGMPVFLNYENDFDKLNSNVYQFSQSIEQNAAKLLDLKEKDTNFMWNKPYYMKLFFNNLGTWRSGLFQQNKFHDQVNYKFLMPVFVVGSWDIIAPQELLPEWDPPLPFIKKITLKNLLPFSNMGFVGKLMGTLFLLVIVVIGSMVFFPGIVSALLRMFKK